MVTSQEWLEEEANNLVTDEQPLVCENEYRNVWQNRSNYSGSSALLIAVQLQPA
jgi:hypothetical protein